MEELGSNTGLVYPAGPDVSTEPRHAACCLAPWSTRLLESKGIEMKILVYGAGVLGSLYAARLKESGHDVTVLARGKRFDEIEGQGIVLEHALKGTRSVTPVEVTKDLKPDDCYDLVLVVMRRNQVADVLPALAASRKTALVVFMVNNALGYGEWLKAVGRDRLLVGFAGVGGTRVEGVVYYHVVSPLLQPTTFGDPEGGVTERVKALARVFRRAGFPTAVCPDMDAWQRSGSPSAPELSGRCSPGCPVSPPPGPSARRRA